MLLKNTFFFIGLFLLISCEKQNQSPEQNIDYIVFGHFYGFCVGEQCIEIYKLTDDSLHEDTSDTYPRWDRYDEGKWMKLDLDKFEQVKSLGGHIPQQLISAEETVFGAPDAADGGGIFFAIKNDDGIRFWLIDQFDQNIPTYLRPFKDQINNSISMIND